MSGRVCVIGAGIIGLGSALSIAESLPNVQVTLVAENFTTGAATSASGGLWNPRDTLTTTPLSRIQEWTRGTWKFILPIAVSSEATKAGIDLVPGYRLYSNRLEGDADNPWYKDDVIGLRRVPESEIKQLFPNSPFRDGYFYTAIISHVPTLLVYLMERFKKAGGKVLQRRVKSLGEFAGQYDVVVNCSGIGARILANDSTVEPVRGQVMAVKAPNQHFFIMGYLDQADPNNKEKVFAVFPRREEVILGGTWQPGRWDASLDEADSRDIFQRTMRACPQLEGAEIISHKVGLRPSRPEGVRLEPETMKFGSRSLEVIHNYGHEGNGVTLYWGCAEEATRLVKQALDKRGLNSRL